MGESSIFLTMIYMRDNNKEFCAPTITFNIGETRTQQSSLWLIIGKTKTGEKGKIRTTTKKGLAFPIEQSPFSQVFILKNVIRIQKIWIDHFVIFVCVGKTYVTFLILLIKLWFFATNENECKSDNFSSYHWLHLHTTYIELVIVLSQ